MPIAVFDYGMWSARYPELAGSVDAALGGAYFAEAGLYLPNDECSPVADVSRRGVLLNMLVAHIAKLNAPINGQAPSGGVGRVESATEGGVTVKLSIGEASDAEQWYAQTQYGWAFWNSTRGLRTARYVSVPPRNFEPYPGMAGRYGWPL